MADQMVESSSMTGLGVSDCVRQAKSLVRAILVGQQRKV